MIKSMIRSMSHVSPPRAAVLSLLAIGATLGLSACATSEGHKSVADTTPPRLPSEQYPLEAESRTKSISLRINASGLSENQRRALDQVAEQASWMRGDPIDVAVITAGDPGAISAGRKVGSYLIDHDVPAQNLTQASAQEQPADIITVNMTFYRAHTYDCNQSWENLSHTATNKTYKNFGCALTSNLAAQIADPRDLKHAAAATSSDALRKSAILEKYRKGEVTSAAEDDQSKGTISDAIK